MTKPLSITSPTHAVALANYFILGLSGIIGVLHLNQGNVVSEAMGPAVSSVWATTLMMGAFGAFFSALAAHRAKRPEYNLQMEMYSNFAIAANLIFYLVFIMVHYGSRGINVATFAFAFGVGSLLRAFQIMYERNLIKKARAHPSEADPVMGDPRDDPERG